jgi:hypothetical protein
MPIPQCLDLRELFGDRYIVIFEESYAADLGHGCGRGDPWLQIIPSVGSRGHIFPWGGDKLAASVDKGRLVKSLMALGCCALVQDGDSGGTVTFALQDFAKVAAIMRPRRRRRLKPEQRRKNAQRLQAHRRDKPRKHTAADSKSQSGSGKTKPPPAAPGVTTRPRDS